MAQKVYPDEVTDLKAFIKSFLLNERGQLKGSTLRALPARLKLALEAATSNLSTSNLSERVYWIWHGLTSYPKACKTCGRDVTRFHSFGRGYPHDYCSSRCANSNKLVQAKKARAVREKYGVDFPWQGEAAKGKIRQAHINKWFERRFYAFAPEYLPVTTAAEYQGPWAKFRWRHECGHVFEQDLIGGIIRPMCPACQGTYGDGERRQEIYNFIRQVLPAEPIVQGDRSTAFPLELDIYLPNRRLAVRYHELHQHSYNRRESREERLALYEMYRRCTARGIRLIQIFEHEWEGARGIVEARLRSALGVNDKIGARSCAIVELSAKESGEFLRRHHLQGDLPASVRLGLTLGGELVAVMTFSRPRFSKRYEWELARYCSRATVVGGASRLLTHFKRRFHPRSIVTYADLRWSDGNLYRRLGFTLERVSAPNYFYFKEGELHSRYAFQKGRLKDRLPVFDAGRPEHENAFINGYRRCWDAGNLIFSWEAGN